MRIQAVYEECIRRSREEATLASCAALLEWDELTYMPRGGVENRGQQMAYLAGLQHDKATDPRWGELLRRLEDSALVRDPDSPTAVNIREWRRLYDRATRLPGKLVEEAAWLISMAQQEWVVAFEQSDFSHFRPWLEKVVKLKREEAAALGFQEDPYDALLEDYEPGARTRELVMLFSELRQDLQPLVAALRDAPRKPNISVLHRTYPLDRQQIFGETVAAAVGFDFHRGRLDTTTHPFFATIGPGDCRITTRYNLHSFSDAFFAILHEVGHALYEQGLDSEHVGTPMGEVLSLALHESQSRLWENLVGRSRPFWVHFFPLARQVFHEALHDVSLDEFHFAVNQVIPSVNRVQADEVTYNLHILIRFDLERALLLGDLKVADLPTAWSEAYDRELGIVPENDREGCLQDGHWAAGQIGYFPTYTLGNLYAAQLYARADQELGGLEGSFSRGDFGDLLQWLREKVHRHGSRYPAPILLERVTDSTPRPGPLIEALQRKYTELYGL